MTRATPASVVGNVRVSLSDGTLLAQLPADADHYYWLVRAPAGMGYSLQVRPLSGRSGVTWPHR
jgi:hypothetical protein